MFVTGESDEETKRVVQASHRTTMKVQKPDPSSFKVPSAISPIFPNSFSPAKSTQDSLTSAPQTQPGDVFPVSSGNFTSSFGKPSSYAISTPTLLPDAPASTGILKSQPLFQDSSFEEPGKLNTEPKPSTGGTPIFAFVESSRKMAVSSAELENVPNGVPKPTLQNKSIHPNVTETTEPAARIQSQTPAERSLQHQMSLCDPKPFAFDPHTQDVLPIPSKPYLPPENPKVLQDFQSASRTSLSPQGIPPISMSFASNQKLAATGNGTTLTSSSVDPRHSLTTKTANLSQPSVSLAAPQTKSFPALTSIQEPRATDSRSLPQNFPPLGLNTTFDSNSEVRQGSAVRTDPKRNCPSNTIHSGRRSIMLSTLSDGIMHNDGALLQQFVEYVIGPIIIDSIRETRDRRSWKQASQ